MFETDLDKSHATPRKSGRTGVLWLLSFGVGAALAGNTYQYFHGKTVDHELNLAQVNAQRQIARLTETAEMAIAQSQQRLETLKTEMETGAAANLKQTRSELTKGSSAIAQNVEKKHQEVAGQLSDLKRETDSKLSEVSSGLEQTGAKLTQVSSSLDQTGSELKRTVGDLGVVSGEVATNSKELAVLKQLGEREYLEFDLAKSKDPQRVGDVWLTLKKTDEKHNRYTLVVLADDKVVEKKDRTINEPVQLYLSGSRLPYEIVINEVKKDQVIGYVAVPKVRAPRGKAA